MTGWSVWAGTWHIAALIAVSAITVGAATFFAALGDYTPRNKLAAWVTTIAITFVVAAPVYRHLGGIAMGVPIVVGAGAGLVVAVAGLRETSFALSPWCACARPHNGNLVPTVLVAAALGQALVTVLLTATLVPSS
ncbi:hypothetical protein [Gordonia sputi]